MPAVNKERSSWCAPRGQINTSIQLPLVASSNSNSSECQSSSSSKGRPNDASQADRCPQLGITSICSSPSGLAMSCVPGSYSCGGSDFSSSTSSATVPPYERAIKALHNDEGWAREITLGKRVGLYRLRGDLGSGNFSKVKIAIHHLTKETVAIKTLDKTKLDARTHRMLNREIAIMQHLCHPNIVKLFEVIETFDKVHLVLECAGGGDLCARITDDGRMSEDKSRRVFGQVISAIDYLHSRNVIHRDIKAENVFLSSDEPTTVKVGDFGFSTNVSSADERLRTFCGSPPYAAPELFQDESYVGPSVDVWALGVLIFLVVTGSMPFHANTVTNLKRLILDNDYGELPDDVTSEFRALIRGILRRNPNERFTLQQIVDSPWMTMSKSISKSARSMSTTTTGHHQGLQPYHPWPTNASSEQPEVISKLEAETRRRMALLGITDEDIAKASAVGNCNHPVTGTFRIFMHVLHATFGDQQRDLDDQPEPEVATSCTGGGPSELSRSAAGLPRKDTTELAPLVSNSSDKRYSSSRSNSAKIKVKTKLIRPIKKSRTCTLL